MSSIAAEPESTRLPANRGDDQPVEFVLLESLHHELLCRYVDAIGRAARMTAKDARDMLIVRRSHTLIARRLGEPALSTLLAIAVRQMVGSHVRSKLREIEQIYGQIGATMPAAGGTRENAWLTAARDQVSSCRESIPSFRMRATLTLLPSLIGFAPKLLGSAAPIATLVAVVALIYLVMIAGGIVALNGSRAFALKRDLFLEPVRSESDQLSEDEAGRRSIYEVEDHLFRALRRPKRREARLDAWLWPGFVISIAIAYAAAMAVALNDPGLGAVSAIEGVVVAIVIAVSLSAGSFRARQRRDRTR